MRRGFITVSFDLLYRFQGALTRGAARTEGNREKCGFEYCQLPACGGEFVYALLCLAIFQTYRSSFYTSVGVSLTAAAGIWMAGYQTWLQRFAVNVSCTADQPWWESFVYWAGERVPLLFEATGLCSEAGWKFMSLSIAEWSLLMFAAMAVGAIRAAALSRR